MPLPPHYSASTIVSHGAPEIVGVHVHGLTGSDMEQSDMPRHRQWREDRGAEEYRRESETRVKAHGQKGLAVSEPRHTEGEGEKWDSGPGLIFLASCWPWANHWTTPYFFIRKWTHRWWEQLCCRPQGLGRLKGDAVSENLKGPGCRLQPWCIEVTTLATHGPIFLPHSIVLLSP